MKKYPKNIISFVAKESGSGKTTLIERIIEELKKTGLKITVVKHTNHPVSLDNEGKDTFKFAEKGADRIMLFSDESLYMYELKKPDLSYIISLASKDVDLVIIEGYKEGPFQKIEVFNSQLCSTPLCIDSATNNIIALVSNVEIKTDLPLYGFDDIDKICAFILDKCDL
jgi:molybdopterin-guanine dinucleotide biosynthesis protein B